MKVGWFAFVIARAVVEWVNARFSLVGDMPFFDPRQFEWVARVDAGWKSIHAELLGVLHDEAGIPSLQDIMPEQRTLEQPAWKTFVLYLSGRRIDQNCARCPETERLLQNIPGLQTAFFSILPPGKGLPPHRGLYNGLLRYHLGLIVPAERTACRIRVKDEWRHWEEGKSLLFDDTYDHEVRNEAETVRVVLFVDFLRPLPGWVGRYQSTPKALFMTVWRPSTRSAEHSCGIRQG